MEPRDLLSLYEVEDRPGLFVLGSFARRVVTVASQQTRALNLIWAMNEVYGDLGNRSVTVVGAGFAGLTAAVAAARAGAKVTLVEKATEILPLQRGCTTRFLHPYILSWPRKEFSNETTDFPFLNWRAGIAGEIVSELMPEWIEAVVDDRIEVLTGNEVVRIVPGSGAPARYDLELKSHESETLKNVRLEKQEFVILAVGFGLERKAEGLEGRSYWSSDSLHQPIDAIETRDRKKYLVSGLGDGGTIDCLRLRTVDFSHQRLVKTLGLDSPDPKMQKLRDDLQHIEEIGSDLATAYESLDIPSTLKRAFIKRLRKDTHVTFVGNSSRHPFTHQSCILNRFCVFLLHKYDHEGFLYVNAKLVRGSRSETVDQERRYPILVELETGDSAKLQVPVDDVIVRHGAEPVAPKILDTCTTNAADRFRTLWASLSQDDPAMKPTWKEGNLWAIRPPRESAAVHVPKPADPPPAAPDPAGPRWPSKPGKPFVLPFHSIADFFFGRQKFLDALFAESHAELPKSGSHSKFHVLAGLGGVGKTRLAVEYAWKFATSYSAVFFVRGNDVDAFEADIAHHARSVSKLEVDPQATAEAIVERFGLHLNDNPEWLLIVDNVDDPAAVHAIENHLSRFKGGHVIVTSRIRLWNPPFSLKDVHVLLRRDSVCMILKRTEARRKNRRDDRKQANAIARELGDLCLALNQACSYINVQEFGLEEYLQEFRNSARNVLEFVDDILVDELERKEARTVASTWLTSFRHLSPNAMRLLRCLSHVSSDPIPEFFARSLGSGSNGSSDWRKHKAEIARYSFLSTHSGPENHAAGSSPGEPAMIGDIHRLVRLVVRAEMPPEEYASTLDSVFRALLVIFQGDPADHETHDRCRHVIEHAIESIEQSRRIPPDQVDPEILGELCHRVGIVLKGQDSFARAEPMLTYALIQLSRSGRPDQTRIAELHNDLAELFRIGNRFAEARDHLDRAERIWISAGLAESREAACTWNCFGLLFDDQGDFQNALDYYRKALDIRHAQLALEPGDAGRRAEYATTLNDLGELHRETRDFETAKSLFEESLALRESVHGQDHPLVAQTLNNLVNLKIETRDPAGVESHLARIDAIRKRIFRKNHQFHYYTEESYGRYFELVENAAEAARHHEEAFRILCRFEEAAGSAADRTRTFSHPAFASQKSRLSESLRKLNLTPSQIEARLRKLLPPIPGQPERPIPKPRKRRP